MSIVSPEETVDLGLSAVGPSQPGPLKKWLWRLSSYNYIIAPILTLLALVAFWEWAIGFWNIPKFKLPAPSEIWRASTEPQWLERLPTHIWVTLYETLVGFGLGVFIGVPLAVIIAFSRPLQNTIYPVLLLLQSVPKVALAPILVFTMGLGDGPKIAVAFLVSFFPIVVDTASGLKSVDSEMVDMLHSFSANSWDTFRRVRFPAALPFIFSGLKVAISLAVVGAVIGEFVASDKGLGNLILIATANANNGLAFGAMVLLAIMGIILFALVALVERLVLWYR